MSKYFNVPHVFIVGKVSPCQQCQAESRDSKMREEVRQFALTFEHFSQPRPAFPPSFFPPIPFLSPQRIKQEADRQRKEYDKVYRRAMRPVLAELFYPAEGENILDRPHLGIVNASNRADSDADVPANMFQLPRTGQDQNGLMVLQTEEGAMQYDSDNGWQSGPEDEGKERASSNGEVQQKRAKNGRQSTIGKKARHYVMPYPFLNDWRTWVRRPQSLMPKSIIFHNVCVVELKGPWLG